MLPLLLSNPYPSILPSPLSNLQGGPLGKRGVISTSVGPGFVRTAILSQTGARLQSPPLSVRPPPFPYPPSLHLPSFSTGTSGFSKISFEGLAAVAMRSPYSGSLNVVRAAMDDPLVVGGELTLCSLPHPCASLA